MLPFSPCQQAWLGYLEIAVTIGRSQQSQDVLNSRGKTSKEPMSSVTLVASELIKPGAGLPLDELYCEIMSLLIVWGC